MNDKRQLHKIDKGETKSESNKNKINDIAFMLYGICQNCSAYLQQVWLRDLIHPEWVV